jgi:hypothetical protein
VLRIYKVLDLILALLPLPPKKKNLLIGFLKFNVSTAKI